MRSCVSIRQQGWQNSMGIAENVDGLTARQTLQRAAVQHAPSITAKSSLQSNWNASPGASTKDTNAPRLVVFNRSYSARRHVRANAATRLYEPTHPLATTAACSCFAVRLACCHASSLSAPQRRDPARSDSCDWGNADSSPRSKATSGWCSSKDARAARSRLAKALHADADAESHSIDPCRSLLSTPARTRAEGGGRWLKIR